MSTFEDDEIDNYRAKYGFINLNDTHFDDHPDLGFEFLQYKISKIKIWKAKKDQITVLGGIQTTYLNNADESTYVSEEHKGEKVVQDEFVEFNLQKNEYIVKASLWSEESCICKIIFKTNLKNVFSVGDARGEEMEVSEFEKNNFLLSFFGTYGDNYLTSIGMFINHDKNNHQQFFDYFIRGFFEVKLLTKKDKYKKEIQDKIQKRELTDNEKTLFKACLLPKTVFNEIIKFTNPLYIPK